ncbi:MAG: glycosyltransferase [Candidatus Limnocylindrales bacterium]|nr:glycosyltransferase [Candidatus Limnocylindrales bacterium]
MPALRVLTLARWYPSHDSPGRGSFVADLVRATVGAGVAARVVSFDRVLTRGRLEEREAALVAARAAYARVAKPAALFVTPATLGAHGVPVARVPVVRRPGVDDVSTLVEDYLVALRPFLWQLSAEWRPDVIHAHTGLPDGAVAAQLGRELSIPVLVTEHASTIETELADPTALGRYRMLLEPGVRLLAVSPSAAERLAGLLGVSVDRIEVLPNPVSDDSFPLADPAGRDPDELLWVGSLGEHKGIEVLLHAFARVLASRPSLHLRLVGNERMAGDRARWQALAAELKIDGAVAIDGWLDRGAVVAAMARAVLFVHPSPSETFGIVAAEAVLSGLPVAARRSGGVPWIVELSGGYGSVADGDDSAAFARAIEAALAGPLPVDAATARASLIREVGQAAVAERALDLYRRTLAEYVALASSPGTRLQPAGLDATGRSSPATRRSGRSTHMPRILVATGRNHALAMVAELPADLRRRLVLVVPPLSVGVSADGAPAAAPAVRLHEASPIPPRRSRPRGRSPLARLRRASYRPAPTADEQLAAAVLAAAGRWRLLRRPVEIVAIDAPAAALVARLAARRIELAPGSLRWLADRWDAERGKPN